MHGITTIERVNRENAEAARIIERNEESGAYQRQDETFAANVAAAQKRLAEGRTAV